MNNKEENKKTNEASEIPAPASQEESAPLSDSAVTAKTSSMWKYNPVPDKPEKYSEYSFSKAEDPDKHFTVTAARVRGKMHKHDGTNCDDWYEFDFGGGMAFAAVSDGAGSKAFSRIGAKTACIAAVGSMKALFTEYFNNSTEAVMSLSKPFDDAEFTEVGQVLAENMRSSAKKAAEAVKTEAEKRKDDKELIEFLGREPVLSDFSATLLMAAVVPVISSETGSMENLVLSIQLGDGMIAAVNADADFDSALSLLGDAESGEFSGETDFITSEKMIADDRIMKHTKVMRRRCTDILLMSDGVADDYFPNDPEILRLYLDLRANGILPSKKAEITENSRPVISKIPKPVKSVWVNDNDISYDFQYMSSVISETGLSLGELWNNPDAAAAASLKSFKAEVSKDNSEQLKIWLDNYVKRGSFDDRTLLIISVGGERT